jgi:hypothetical protein
MVEHSSAERTVLGSIPSDSYLYGLVVQLVEHLTPDQKVIGSNPIQSIIHK